MQKFPHAPKLQMTCRWKAETLSSSELSGRAASPSPDDLSPFPIKGEIKGLWFVLPHSEPEERIILANALLFFFFFLICFTGLEV